MVFFTDGNANTVQDTLTCSSGGNVPSGKWNFGGSDTNTYIGFVTSNTAACSPLNSNPNSFCNYSGGCRGTQNNGSNNCCNGTFNSSASRWRSIGRMWSGMRSIALSLTRTPCVRRLLPRSFTRLACKARAAPSTKGSFARSPMILQPQTMGFLLAARISPPIRIRHKEKWLSPCSIRAGGGFRTDRFRYTTSVAEVSVVPACAFFGGMPARDIPIGSALCG